MSERDYATLLRLREYGYIRVIATGRSLYSISRVLPDDFPIDYLVFSSGAGIMDWQKKKLILKKSLDREEIESVCSLFRERDFDFMIHEPIPENHRFYYYTGTDGRKNMDFERRNYGRDMFIRRICSAIPTEPRLDYTGHGMDEPCNHGPCPR